MIPIPHVNYPHQEGYLIDCEACERQCHCTKNSAECVWRGHNEELVICEVCSAAHAVGEDCPNYGYGETHAR